MRKPLAWLARSPAAPRSQETSRLTTDPGRNGYDRDTVERLDHRASVLAPVTRLILQQAGIAPGMRVLDLGTGTGAVARLAAEMVGPTGRVVGLDRAPRALAAAEQRRRADDLTNVSFVEGDVDSWEHDGDFDAVIARLILFHLRDPAAALAHHARSLRPGARVIAMDLDASAVRSVPATPSVTETVEWILRGFQQIGANATMGTRLGSLLESAGLRDPTVLGFTTYHPWRDPDGPLLLAGIVRSSFPPSNARDNEGRRHRRRQPAPAHGGGARHCERRPRSSDPRRRVGNRRGEVHAPRHADHGADAHLRRD